MTTKQIFMFLRRKKNKKKGITRMQILKNKRKKKA